MQSYAWLWLCTCFICLPVLPACRQAGSTLNTHAEVVKQQVLPANRQRQQAVQEAPAQAGKVGHWVRASTWPADKLRLNSRPCHVLSTT